MITEATQDTEKKEPTPADWAKRWQRRISAARKWLQPYFDAGDKVVDQYLDERQAHEQDEMRWNLFASNVQTQEAMLYGKPPTVTVERRFTDARDDTARVSAEILRRILNCDLERDGDGFVLSTASALQDRLLSGGGNVRFRYVRETEKVAGTPAITDPNTGAELAPAVPETERVVREDVETDYVHWKDQLWSPSRTHAEVTWWAFKAQMSRPELLKRFGDIAETVPLNAQKTEEDPEGKKDPEARAEVWEIWDKDSKHVFWYVDGFAEVLDMKEDPYGLEGFFPFPRPLFGNLTTKKYIPRSDYVMAQDLYLEINNVSTRIDMLEDAVKVVGVYDRSSDALKTVLTKGTGNKLIPVENWGAFAEKGGLKGVMDFMPLDQVIQAILALRDYRRELIDALHQITGMSDLMRGQATEAATTATEQSIKAKFGSVRVQSRQDEFARFVSDGQKIRAELISKLFEPETILKRSNAEHMGEDPALVQAGIQLIKEQFTQYRIEVKPEAVSFTDFAALKQERMEVLTAIGGYLQVIGPLIQLMGPQSLPFMLEILKVSLAGLRGASAYEAIVDRAIAAAQQAAAQPQQPQMDPKEMMKMQTAQMKIQGDMAKEQAKLQGDLVRLQAETQAKAQQEQTQMEWNVKEAAAKQQVANALRPPPQPGKPGGLQK